MNSSNINKQEICKFFKRGQICKFGDQCWFSHSNNPKVSEAKGLEPKESEVGESKTKESEVKRPYTINRTINGRDINRQKSKRNPSLRGSKVKNTENFNPSHIPADIRILVENVKTKEDKTRLSFQTQDVVVVPNLFGEMGDLTIYNNLLKEMKESGIDESKLWKLWHGDSHLIADDHLNFKEKIPTFMMVINRIKEYFNMDIKATRFNYFRDDSDWKPFHHDASAVNPEKAKIQNFTVGVSFGAPREIAFEDALNPKRYRRVISVNLPNATTYAFTRDININWRHGIPQLPKEKQGDLGRISIIAWGSVNQNEA